MQTLINTNAWKTRYEGSRDFSFFVLCMIQPDFKHTEYGPMKINLLCSKLKEEFATSHWVPNGFLLSSSQREMLDFRGHYSLMTLLIIPKRWKTKLMKFSETKSFFILLSAFGWLTGIKIQLQSLLLTFFDSNLLSSLVLFW